jgi:photosystem II stability/assembly factor-like uncharacterized protein
MARKSQWRESAHRCGGQTWLSRWLLVAPLLAIGVLLASCDAPHNTPWQALGTQDGGRVLSLAVDPFRPNLVYAGTTNGIVYRLLSTTAAHPLPGAGIPDQAAVGALLPDPQVRGTLYAATSAGLYVSTDDGDHWQARGSGLPQGDNVNALIFGADTRTLLAGSAHHGAYLSHDLGASWTPADGGLPAGATVNALLLTSAGGAVLAALTGAGIVASTDGGQTWQPGSAGLPAKADVYALATMPAQGLAAGGPTLYAGTSGGVFASTDGGHTWSAPVSDAAGAAVHALAADPAHPGTLYAGTEQTVLRSTDGGRQWSEVAPGLAQPVAAIVTAPQAGGQLVVFVAADRVRRYPAFAGQASNPLGAAANILVIAVVLAAGAWAYIHTRRQLTRGLASAGQPWRPSRRDEAPAAGASDEKARANGHRPLTPGSTSPATSRSEPDGE